MALHSHPFVPCRHTNDTSRSAEGFFEPELNCHVKIDPALGRLRLPGVPLVEDLGHQIAERRAVVRASGREVEPFEARRPPVGWPLRYNPEVVAVTSLRVDEGLVSLENLAEAHVCRLIARIDVRMVPAREATIGPLDLGVRRPVPHAQNHIQVHQVHS